MFEKGGITDKEFWIRTITFLLFGLTAAYFKAFTFIIILAILYLFISLKHERRTKERDQLKKIKEIWEIHYKSLHTTFSLTIFIIAYLFILFFYSNWEANIAKVLGFLLFVVYAIYLGSYLYFSKHTKNKNIKKLRKKIKTTIIIFCILIILLSLLISLLGI